MLTVNVSISLSDHLWVFLYHSLLEIRHMLPQHLLCLRCHAPLPPAKDTTHAELSVGNTRPPATSSGVMEQQFIPAETVAT